MAVNQGKTAFQQQWGKRENTDDWRRMNRTVVNLNATDGSEDTITDSISMAATDSLATDSIMSAESTDAKADTLANDPHNREYYLAQIPFTEEQKAASDNEQSYIATVRDSKAFTWEALYNDAVKGLAKFEKITKKSEFPDAWVNRVWNGHVGVWELCHEDEEMEQLNYYEWTGEQPLF